MLNTQGPCATALVGTTNRTVIVLLYEPDETWAAVLGQFSLLLPNIAVSNSIMTATRAVYGHRSHVLTQSLSFIKQFTPLKETTNRYTW